MTTTIDNSVLIDEGLWSEYVARHGLGRARALLCEIKNDLKTQRRARQPIGKLNRAEATAHMEWTKSQARFEGLVNRRLTEVEQALADRAPDTGADSARGIRKGLVEAIDIIGWLCKEIDNSEVEYLLDERTIVLGGETMTLAEALDAGRFN